MDENRIMLRKAVMAAAEAVNEAETDYRNKADKCREATERAVVDAHKRWEASVMDLREAREEIDALPFKKNSAEHLLAHHPEAGAYDYDHGICDHETDKAFDIVVEHKHNGDSYAYHSELVPDNADDLRGYRLLTDAEALTEARKYRDKPKVDDWEARACWALLSDEYGKIED